jgi:pimeloyl-ACP methyl ester carboxylesterase
VTRISGVARRSVAGVELEVRSYGSGAPLLYLHGQEGLLFCEPFLKQLGQHHEVVVPSHPGWSGSPRSEQFRTLDDIAYLYLDLLDEMGGPVPVVGASLGAWLAMEMATKCQHGMSALALLSPVGIRTGGPTQRHYLDQYASPPATVAAALYGAADRRPARTHLDDDEFLDLARAQESTAFFVWEPYMHNPSLLDRLHRITVPTLVITGERDGVVLAPDHVDTLVGRLGARADVLNLPDVGHLVEEQAPVEVTAALHEFLTGA